MLLVIPSTNDDWITFKLGLDGHWSYDVGHDISNGGFPSGNGTSTLVFQGYPLLIDARASGGVGVTVVPIWAMPFSLTSVEYANLLPAASFELLVRSGVVSAAQFSLTPEGTYVIAPSSTSLLRLDTFKGLRRLTVVAPI